MRIVRSIDDYEAGADLLLTIGVFDGVHIGHRAVLSKLVGSRARGTIAAALTFERHPQAYLQPSEAPKSITTLEEKINLLAGCGLDLLFLLPFDERVARIPARAFLKDILVERMRVRSLIVGPEWRFGKGREGDAGMASDVLGRLGCSFQTATLLEREGEKVSSSRIRELIAEMAFAQADALLGSSYCVRGTVRTGDGRGHSLGFPTANLEVAPDKLIPPSGVFSTIAHHDGSSHRSLTSIGDKPTFGGRQLTVETYILDFDASIYGEQLALTDWHFLRPQERFADSKDLAEQMQRDVQAAR